MPGDAESVSCDYLRERCDHRAAAGAPALAPHTLVPVGAPTGTPHTHCTHSSHCRGPEPVPHTRFMHGFTLDLPSESNRTTRAALRVSFQRVVTVQSSVTAGRSPRVRGGVVHSIGWQGHMRPSLWPLIHPQQGQCGVEGWGRESLKKRDKQGVSHTHHRVGSAIMKLQGVWRTPRSPRAGIGRGSPAGPGKLMGSGQDPPPPAAPLQISRHVEGTPPTMH